MKMDGVHIWFGKLSASQDELLSLKKCLSHDEQERAARFKFRQHQEAFVISRGYLRYILSSYINVLPRDVYFEYLSHGKPILPKSIPMYFNLSHSHNFFLLGITSTYPIGVDIEWINQQHAMQDIAQRYFSPKEYASFNSLLPCQKLEGFYNAWTRKEAIVKAIGDGFQFSWQQFSVSLVPEEPCQLLEMSGLSNSEWTLWDFVPSPGYKAAIAVQGPVALEKIQYLFI